MRLFNFCMGYLFNLVTTDGVIEIKHIEHTKKKSKVYIGGVELSAGERQELINDAKAIQRLGGYQKILNSMRASATIKLVNKSVTIDDMVAGKVLLYSVDVEQRLIHDLANLSQ